MSDEKIEYLFSNLKDFMSDKFNQINDRFEDLEARTNIRFEEFEKKVNDRFEEHEEKQRIDFAKLEYVMYDRTEALFDASEVSSDKDNNLYKKLKSLERVLDKHHYRITELESKII